MQLEMFELSFILHKFVNVDNIENYGVYLGGKVTGPFFKIIL